MEVNFFLVGVSKAGTSTIHEILQNYDSVFLTIPKEPHFFSGDLPGLKTTLVPLSNLNDYKNLFKEANSDAKVVGECSACYLYSQLAIERIIKTYPNAKFLAILRAPLELLPSFHQQLVNNFDEDIQDLESAWEAQEDRQQGKRIPKTCKEPKILQYKKFVTFSEQVERLYKHVPKNQRLVLLHEDLRSDPNVFIANIENFLGLKPKPFTAIRKINTRREHRFPLISSLILNPPFFSSYIHKIRLCAQQNPNSLLAKFRLYFYKTPRSFNNQQFLRKIGLELTPDIDKLSKIIQKDLSHWKVPPKL